MRYKRAPITEAVIELRFARAVERKTIEAAAKRAAKDYPIQEPESSTNLQLTIKGALEAQVQQSWSGVKLSSLDRSDNLLFRTSAFACSRLAPYLGWDQFKDRAIRDWGTLRTGFGAGSFSRIGLRYINRLDVPMGVPALMRVDDYLNLVPKSPTTGLTQPMTSYTMQIVHPMTEDHCSATLNSGTVPSPLIGFASFLLDIDVSTSSSLPGTEDELWQLLDRMRVHKNRIFEACVTDKARGLFDRP